MSDKDLTENARLRRDVKVYYNPEDPTESVLVPGLNPANPYSDLILGALGVVTGIIIAILAWLDVFA